MSALAETEENMLDPFDPFTDPVAIEISDSIDLHTIAPRDVKRVVEEYLYQAHQAGFLIVRIVHGKGMGVQREIVRTVLARTTFVANWADAPPEAGGWGATVVRLSASTTSDELHNAVVTAGKENDPRTRAKKHE